MNFSIQNRFYYMRKMPIIFVFGVISLTISSCAVQNEKSDYRLGNNVGKGLVVFSLSLEGSRSLYITYRRLGIEEQNVVALKTYGIKGVATNYDWKDPFGRLIYLELEAGQYEFHGWHPAYCGWEEKCLPLAEKIRFSVLPDTASYIGNIHFKILRRDQAYKFEIRDEFDRDVSLLSNRLVNVNSDQVEKILPTIAEE